MPNMQGRDVDVAAIVHEYRRLNAELAQKTQQLDSLLATNGEQGDFPTDFEGAQNRRYSVDFEFKPGVLEPQERSVTVANGSIFRCAYMETFIKAVGTAFDEATAQSLSVGVTLPWNERLRLFDFFWTIRDTGTDREWVDFPQPSLFGGGGYVGPFWYPRRVILGGGNRIIAGVQPFLNVVNPVSTFFPGPEGGPGTIQQYTVQISFVGHEVPDRSPL